MSDHIGGEQQIGSRGHWIFSEDGPPCFADGIRGVLEIAEIVGEADLHAHLNFVDLVKREGL
ncbi:MAG: hypothetical protein ACFB11_12875 [Paracoccaceae bacterium]